MLFRGTAEINGVPPCRFPDGLGNAGSSIWTQRRGVDNWVLCKCWKRCELCDTSRDSSRLPEPVLSTSCLGSFDRVEEAVSSNDDGYCCRTEHLSESEGCCLGQRKPGCNECCCCLAVWIDRALHSLH